MSNFICSECGMTNIDCGGSGYKTPKEIELENQIADLSKKVHILNEANMKLENELGQFADASKTIERLQEQINEANEIITDLSEYPPINISTRELSSALNRYNAKKYLEKWGVK